jgi:hypothetical protein
LNHWWHVSLYVSPRGLTTGPIPVRGGRLQIDLDLLDHALAITTQEGARREVKLGPRSIADFYADYARALEELGQSLSIPTQPYDCKSKIPYPEDTEHTTYDARAVTRAWRTLSTIDELFWEFRSRFVGKCSPVHLFWHSFDLAVTRFSGRPAPNPPEAKVAREAYSHEVCSAGFWFGDDSLPEAAFYCYAWPAPERLQTRSLSSLARWDDVGGAPQARMLYEPWRRSSDPAAALFEFLESSYTAIADLAHWDRAVLERAR